MATGIFERKGRRGSTFYVQFILDGKRYRHAVGPDKREAVALARHIDKERAVAKAANRRWEGLKELKQEQRGSKTFEQAAIDYIEGMAQPKPSTREGYLSILKCHLAPVIGQKELRDIKPSDIRTLQAAIARGRSASRVNTIIQFARAVFAQAVIDEEIERNPCQAVKRLVQERPDIAPFSDDELQRIFAVIDEHYRPLFICLVHTGARPNELQALRWSDIDWEQELISISKGRVRGKEGLPKTRNSKRKIPMVEPVRQALLEIKERSVKGIGDYVFVNKQGRPIDKNLDRIWRRAEKKAGVIHRRGYQLRHTFATKRIQEGFPPNKIAAWLGHNVDTLFRHYAGLIEQQSVNYNAQLKGLFCGRLSGRVEAENSNLSQAVAG